MEKCKECKLINLDWEKIRTLFDKALARLTVEVESGKIEEHDIVQQVEKLLDLHELNLIEKLIMLAIVNAKLYSKECPELKKFELLEIVSFLIYQSLIKSNDLDKVMFVIGRLSERIIREFPALSRSIDEEIKRALSKKKPGYIS